MVEVVGRDGAAEDGLKFGLMPRASCNAGLRATRGHGARMKRRARWLQRLRRFGIGARSSGRPHVRPEFGRGCSSGVEHDLAKVGVEGSNPFARSRICQTFTPGSRNVSSHVISREAAGKQLRKS